VKTSLSKSALLALIALALVSSVFERVNAPARAQGPAYDLVITNARIVDGSGNPWFRGDVAIRAGRIVRIGRVARDAAAKTIDAHGQILAPGFIDVHTHVESIYSLPSAENFVRMGVTSLVTGNCGSSSAEAGNPSRLISTLRWQPVTVRFGPTGEQPWVRRVATTTLSRCSRVSSTTDVSSPKRHTLSR